MKAYDVASQLALGEYWSQIGTMPYNQINNTFKLRSWKLANESEGCLAQFGRKRGLSLIVLDRIYVGHYNHYMEHIMHLYAAQQTYFPTRKVNRVMFLTASKGMHLFIVAMLIAMKVMRLTSYLIQSILFHIVSTHTYLFCSKMPLASAQIIV